MKKSICLSKKFFRVLGLLFVFLYVTSCNEDKFLEEKPLDFYSTDNSYTSYENFQAALVNLYAIFRQEFYTSRNAFAAPRVTMNGTDLISYDQQAINLVNNLNPNSGFVYSAFWRPAYRIIYDANVIIERSESEGAILSQEDRLKIQAEARFFRGYMYKLLADIYGGVPIVLKETTEPKRDYERAMKNEVYQQCVSDLRFATENLPLISEVDDARISNLAAYHALAESYLSLEEWENAIDAATKVIDNPNTALMTERFGSRINDELDPDVPWASGGDVYWDMFRNGNQNRSSGNTEALWVLQFGYNVPGGANGGYLWELCSSPRTWKLIVEEDDGSVVNMIPFPNTFYGGRGAGQMKPSDYLFNQIWERSGYDQDIRNSEHNIIRDLKVNNPKSGYDGMWIFKDNAPVSLNTPTDTIRNFFPLFAKICSMGDHPIDVWQNDQTVYGSISTAVGPTTTTYRNIYQIRLAETFLVRAEAYMRVGNLEASASDINQIRRRAKAPEIVSSDVSIEYILDERARELHFEENRLQTLTRLGLLVDRTNRYNAFVNYSTHQNLWPVPFSEIEKNTEAELVQNVGY